MLAVLRGFAYAARVVSFPCHPSSTMWMYPAVQVPEAWSLLSVHPSCVKECNCAFTKVRGKPRTPDGKVSPVFPLLVEDSNLCAKIRYIASKSNSFCSSRIKQHRLFLLYRLLVTTSSEVYPRSENRSTRHRQQRKAAASNTI